MDPTTTLMDIRDTLTYGETDEAMGQIDNLREWVQKGGFVPDERELMLEVIFLLQNRID